MLTDEQIHWALEEIFKDFTGYIPISTVLMAASLKLKPDVDEYRFFSFEIERYIHRAMLNGRIISKRGPHGGIMPAPNPESNNYIATVEALPDSINNHTCPSCGNTKCSKTEKSCWKCGGSL